jgi:hypothetical protein
MPRPYDGGVRPLTVAVALCALIATGCGEGEESAPVGCLRGPAAYLEALRQAPGEARLPGDAEISSCLVSDQQAGELARIGLALVRAATELSARAVDRADAPAAMRLGYLVGSVQRGAEQTSGIHADLVRRLEAAASLDGAGRQVPSALINAYRRGLRAGRAGG